MKAQERHQDTGWGVRENPPRQETGGGQQRGNGFCVSLEKQRGRKGLGRLHPRKGGRETRDSGSLAGAGLRASPAELARRSAALLSRVDRENDTWRDGRMCRGHRFGAWSPNYIFFMPRARTI